MGVRKALAKEGRKSWKESQAEPAGLLAQVAHTIARQWSISDNHSRITAEQ